MGLELPPPHLLIRFNPGWLLRGKKQFPVHRFFSNSGLLSLWTGLFFIYIYFLIICQTLSSRIKFQSRAITKRKMGELSSPLSQVTHYDASHFLQTTATVAIRILPNMTHIKKEAYFLVQKSVSLIFMKRFLLYLILWAVMIWWFDLMGFDDLMIFIVGYYNAAIAKQPWKALQNTVGTTSPHRFIFVMYSIPRACQMDSLWSVRILSPPSYFLEADKTGGSASTSDWPESCFSKPQCRGCLALTSNELDIYTFYTDKSIRKACTHIG